jgi:hypothetical protein
MMASFGDESAGFEINVDKVARRLLLRAWGFWRQPALSDAYQRQMQSSFEALKGDKWLLSIDFSEYSPQKPEVQALQEEMISAAKAGGMVKAEVIASNAITRLQVQKLVECSRGIEWSVRRSAGDSAASAAKKRST